MIKRKSISALSLSIILMVIIDSAFAIDKIIINGLFKNKAIVTIDGKQRMLKKGKASPEGALLIQANSKEAIIEIDGQQKTYLLGAHIGSNFSASSGDKKLIIAPDSAGMYNISGTINGFHVPFIVDTGATLVAMNSHVAKKLGIDYKLNGKKSLSNTASGTSKIYIINLRKVKIGDIELHHIKGAVHEGDYPITTLLGMSFLGKLNMKREGRLMELQKKY